MIFYIKLGSHYLWLAYDSGPSDSIFSHNSLVASNCDLGPLDYDLGCTSCNSLAFGYFGDSKGEVFLLLDRFVNVLGS